MLRCCRNKQREQEEEDEYVVVEKPPAAATASLPSSLLAKQNSETSEAVLKLYQGDAAFESAAQRETKSILQRDREDGEKLQAGIELAIGKGVLPAEVKVEKTTKVNVFGKKAEEVADEIIAALGPAAKEGCVLVLQGLSGTGKGTTVATLKAKLPKAVTWSNGNVFRCLTLLAVKHAEQNKTALKESLTPENLRSFLGMLSFAKHDGENFDVKIDGLGVEAYVSKVQNTLLKSKEVGANIPSVAKVTQGEVILFVQDALKQMADDGSSVLVEGREQTLNYIRTPHRFELVLPDEQIIGRRRAAQKMAGAALKALGEGSGGATDEQVKEALDAALRSLSQE